MATARELVAKAASQIGVKENPAGSNKVKYWDYYKEKTGMNLQGSPWCAAFVTWCMGQVGAWKVTKDEGRFRYCPSIVSWAKANGQWLDRNAKPEPGDIILFSNQTRACHVGIVESRPNSSSVITIEGNTSVTSNDNGGSVMRRTRSYGKVGSSWYILGFVRPKWDKWVQDKKGWWYKYADGSYPKNKWLRLDTWYYFDEEGYALRNCWKKLKGYWYYFNDDCRMAKGWKKLKGYWYYMVNNKTGNFPEGAAFTGWLKYKNHWYWLNKTKNGNQPECSMRTGWLEDNGKKYYLKPSNDDSKDGIMAANETLTIDGNKYTFNKSGELV